MKNLKEITHSSVCMLDEIINKLQANPKENLSVLDISSGNGFNSSYIYSKLQTGTYTLVNLSSEIITNSKECPAFNFIFTEYDILSYLSKCSDNSMDVIICAYTISSYSPKKILKECRRVLKFGGFLGVIDNLKGTFPEIKNIYSKLLTKHYNLMNNFVFKSNYSRNEYFFEKMFVNNRFNRINLNSNSNTLNFTTTDSLYSFISSRDILSPLNSGINLEDSEVKSTVLKFLSDSHISTLTHKYIWGTFRNDK